MEENLIFRNPAAGCKLPSAKPREMKVLMPEEIQRLLIQAREDGCYELLLLELSTGLRRGEICGLQWRDFDADDGRLMDSLYFKINVDLPPSQHPYSFQRIYSITGKTVCRFCKDRIDLSPPASRYHRIKSTASLRLCPASNVGINTGECPMRNSLNPFLIVLFL